MDENLTALERRAASRAVRAAKVVAVAVGTAAGVVGGLLLYRRLRRRTVRDRLKGMTVASLRELPTVKVTVNGKDEQPGTVETILRKAGPALLVTASTALLKRIARPRKETES